MFVGSYNTGIKRWITFHFCLTFMFVGHADPRKLWQPSLSNSEYCLLPDYSENSFMSSLQNSHAPRPFQTSSLPTPTTTQELPVACCPVIMQDRTQLPAPASTLVPRCPAGPEFLQLLNAEMPQHDQSPPFSARGSTSFNNEDMEISLDLEVSCLETNSRVSSPSRSHSFSGALTKYHSLWITTQFVFS